MKILYFISVAVEGKGGHYHSLDMISREISKHATTGIICIGPGTSPVIRNNPNYLQTIYSDGFPTPAVISTLTAAVKSFQPDIIHCFDDKVYDFVTYILAFTGKSKFPIMLNRCGGANAAAYPVSKHLVLFMQENYEFYRTQPRFSDTNVYLIPNRVSAIVDKRTSDIFRKNGDEFFLFRIGRINKTYRKTVLESIEVARRLQERGVQSFRLFLIGTNDDLSVYNEINELIKGLPVTIVTDEQVTAKASAYLHYADAAICTGRGFMEACSLGIPVLAGAVNTLVPVPVNPDNFNDFFYFNFSERAVLRNPSGKDPIDELVQIIQNPAVRQSYGDHAANFFAEYFDIGKAVEKYFGIYNSIAGKRVPYFLGRNIRNFLRTARFFRISKTKVLNLERTKQSLLAKTA